LSAKIGFLGEVATKMANQKLGTTTHINNKPPGMCIPALTLTHKPSKVSLAHIDFAPDYFQISFLDLQHIISSQNLAAQAALRTVWPRGSFHAPSSNAGANRA
jgi:hypothetical protein